MDGPCHFQSKQWMPINSLQIREKHKCSVIPRLYLALFQKEGWSKSGVLNFSEVRKNQSGMLHLNFGVIWIISKSHATPLADETSIICFNLRFDNDIVLVYRIYKVTSKFSGGWDVISTSCGERVGSSVGL